MAKIKVKLGQPRFTVADEKFRLQAAQKIRPDNVFDFSILNLFLNCHRAYFYRHEENISVLGSTAPPLVLGGGMHSALEAHHKLLQENGSRSFDYSQHALAMKLAYVKKIKPHILNNAFPMTEENSDGKRYATRGLDIIEEYIKFYNSEDFEIESAELPVAIIIPFEYKDEKGEIVYIGMVDGVILWRDHYYVLENKTVSKLDRYYFPAFKLSYQITGYITAVRELKGLDVKRALINAIGVYKRDYRFERDRTWRSEDELEMFKQQIVNVTRDIFWYRERIKAGEEAENVFYQNPSHCFHWGRACQFHPLCTKPSKAGRDMIKSSMYSRDVWSPFDIYAAES